MYAYAKKLPPGEWVTLIENGSALTHAHERSQVGCLIYAFVLLRLLNEQSKESLFRGLEAARLSLRDYAQFSHYERIFKSDFSALSRDEIQSSGYVVDTLEAALWCALTTDDYKECVRRAVNLGKDTDTVAAVAGGLAGALYGYDAIPTEWCERLIKRDYIEDICRWAAKAWLSV